MHDKYGREVGVGDVVLAPGAWPAYKPEAVKVIGCASGTDTCNLVVVSFEPRVPVLTVTAKECELLLKADGSLPVPKEPPQPVPVEDAAAKE